MSALIRIIYLLALVVWLGEVLFLSLAVAPAMFQAFSAAEAGRVMSALFPIYYKVGYVAGAALLITALILRRSAQQPAAWTGIAAVIAVMLAAALYAGVVVQPRAAELRPQLHDAASPPSVKEEFDRLHRRAVQLNVVVLLGGLAVAIVSATRMEP